VSIISPKVTAQIEAENEAKGALKEREVKALESIAASTAQIRGELLNLNHNIAAILRSMPTKF
jgi:hypothetical protein